MFLVEALSISRNPFNVAHDVGFVMLNSFGFYFSVRRFDLSSKSEGKLFWVILWL